MPSTDERRFGRYRIVGQMADSAMARLLLAVMTGTDNFRRVVVLKHVPPQHAASPEFTRMFLREARIAARLDHPGIVKVFEMSDLDGQYYICMEYLPAEDLAVILKTAKKAGHVIPITIAAMIAQCVADALQCAHDLKDDNGQPLGLVHRDISLSNILVTYHGTVKLTDFGIVKATTSDTDEGATRAGVFKGKYAYASPEQVLGKVVDARTDVFALGIVLWETLTLRRLFKRTNDAATIRAVTRTDVPNVRTFRPDVPEQLEAITLKALARNPKNRFQSAAEMCDALEGILDSVSVRSSSNLLKSWVVELFGEERAELKRAIAQCRGFQQASDDPEDLILSPDKAALLGLKPVGSAGPLVNVSQPSSSQPRLQSLSPLDDREFISVPVPVAALEEAKPTLTAPSPTAQPEPTHPIDHPAPPLSAPMPAPSISIEPEPSNSITQHPGSVSLPIANVPQRMGWVIGLSVGLVLVLGILVWALTQQPRTMQLAPSMAVLEIHSVPEGAHVFLGDEPTGYTTPTNLRLRIGTKAVIELEKADYRRSKHTLEIRERNEPLDVRLEPIVGEVELVGLPHRASVYVDGELKEGAPLRLGLGKRVIRIEAGNRLLFERTIEVQVGRHQIDLRSEMKK